MERSLSLLIISLLCSMSILGATTTMTRTVWSEDFDDTETIQGQAANAAITLSGPAAPATQIAGVQLVQQVNPPIPSVLMGFKYDDSAIEDNWTLSFELRLNCQYPMEQLAITGANTVTGQKIGDDAYVTINREIENDPVTGQPFPYNTIKIGNKLIGSLPETNKYLQPGVLYKIVVTCTNANTSNATLTLSINYETGTPLFTATETIDATAIGKPSGTHLFESQMGLVMFSDNYLLTKDVTVDDTPCSAPTYKMTGANNKARKFTLDCATPGATIYYSESYLTPGEEGWIEYTGETETESEVIYAYAHSNDNDTNSDMINFMTHAGTKLKITAPEITRAKYDETRGYGIVLTPNYQYMDVVPSDYALQYSFDDVTRSTYTEGDTIFVPEGNTLYVYATASGCTESKINQTMAVRPKAPKLWSQDFESLVTNNDTERHAIVLADDIAFQVDEKDLRNIKQYMNGTQAVNINVDKRIALTTDSCFFLVAKNGENGGLLGYKHVKKNNEEEGGEEGLLLVDDEDEGLLIIGDEEEEEEEETEIEIDGLGINGLSDGQYVFIATSGGMTGSLAGANMLQDASTENEQIYVATGSSMLIDIPWGVHVKYAIVRSNFEAVTTNEYGYATYICSNPIDILATQDKYPDDEITAKVVSNEVRSGTFTTQDVDELIANDVFILHGKPNSKYELALGYATTPRYDKNLLTYSNSDFNTSSWENPVYVVAPNGNIVKAAKDSVITAGTPFIKSELEEAEYYEFTLGTDGSKAIVTPKALDFDESLGLEAYIADYETLNNGVHLAKVTSVPAGTPIVIKGTSGTYYIPVGLCTEITGNKLRGSLTESYNTTDTLNQIFTYSPASGNMEVINKNNTHTLPAGTVYFISKYVGMEQITTDAYGTVTLTSSKNLHFEEITLKAYIVVGETETNVETANVSEIPAGTAFIIQGGEPNTTYNVPVHSTATLGVTNCLTSRTTDFNVDDDPHYIWAWSGEQKKFYRTDEGTVIPAGEAFFISEYERKPNLGSFTLKTNSLGFTTYVTEKPLDFSTVDATAYVATEERPNGNIVLTPVPEVPALTAFVIKGQADTEYEIPVGTCEKLNTINLFQGSTTDDFFVGDTVNIVYAISNKTGNFAQVSRTVTIPAGKAYIISKYVGVEYIQTDAYGWACHKNTKALDLREQTGVNAYIAVSQKYGEFQLKELTEIAPNTVFIFHGEPNKNYRIPTGSCTSNGTINLFQSETTDKPVTTVNNNDGRYVYALNSSTGKLEKLDDDYTIPAGQAYIVSDFRGFEQIKTNATGTASYVCEHPLDFTDTKLVAYIATHITVKGVTTLEPVTGVSAGTAFIVKGSADSIYNIPIGTLPDGANENNIFKGSRTESFYVGSVDTYVYALSGKTGNFARVSSTTTIPAGKAYIDSGYRGYEEISTNSTGTASWVCSQPLDFSEFYNLVAYIVTGETESGNIILKPVREVPTGTAFIIKGTPDSTYAVPIGLCEPGDWEWQGQNKLQGSLTESFAVGSVYPNIVYALSAKTGNFAKVSTGATIKAKKAYYISDSKYTTEAKGITGFVEEDYTAIQNTEATNENKRKHRFVNLAGQEVDETYKGIVIDENGRKYNRK